MEPMLTLPPAERLRTSLGRDWLRLALLAWAVAAAWFLWSRWNSVHWLSLGDTDDNMRLMQVRGLLAGQGWYDLTNHRLNPPQGFNIHWSRLVDLPIAALILIFRPFVGTGWAERLACGIAPLLPLGVVFGALSFTVRRLVAPAAWPIALLTLFGATSLLAMFMPMRIDHHGWQLACLSLTLAGLVDPRPVRGAVTVGCATAASLTIGLELLPYGAMAGAILALQWVWDAARARALAAYALALGGGSAAGYVVFASSANQAMRCDALTPVWLSVLVLAAALLLVMAWLNPASRAARLAMGVVAGAIVAGFFIHFFPQCLGRPEGVSPELQRIWLDNVREAKPIYRHPLRSTQPMATLPVAGVIGAAWAAWRARGGTLATAWLAAALFMLFAALMLLWQVRGAPAAQLLAAPGIAAMLWACLASRLAAVRVGAVAVAVAVIGFLSSGYALRWLPVPKADKRTQIVNRAGARCPTLPALRPLDRFSRTVIFTHVDLGPRLIVATHHDAIAGPYHRNGAAILDVHKAFMGTPANFLAIARRHGARLLLLCPNMAETTLYRARAPGGFYDRLAHGEHFAFLTPVPLPKKNPLVLFRIDYPPAR